MKKMVVMIQKVMEWGLMTKRVKTVERETAVVMGKGMVDTARDAGNGVKDGQEGSDSWDGKGISLVALVGRTTSLSTIS
ncbi:hypothetical protein M0802_015311 [Mischocyttarus mexicanus]|nr:hypothetical protein M0802_015311 [Mischocyttarus mexicanus]